MWGIPYPVTAEGDKDNQGVKKNTYEEIFTRLYKDKRCREATH